MKREEEEAREAAREIAAEVARITAENARLLARLGESEQRFRLISRGVLRVQEAERGRISRELHDGVGQALTALKMQLELLERAAAGEPAPLASRLAELTELADRALQDVRQISRLLRPQMLDDLGLLPTLRWLARTVQEGTGIAVRFQCEGPEERIDADLETLLFRVAQEALTNAVKHSGASAVELRLSRVGGNRVRLRVEDHGRGFDVPGALAVDDEQRGFGLRGMRDRVQLFGGRFDLRSAPGSGTVLDVEVPLGRTGEERG